MTFRQLRLRKDANCAVCGERPTVTQLIDYEGFCNPAETGEVTPAQLAEMKDAVLIDVRERNEWDQGYIEGAQLIPMGQLEGNIGSIPKDRDVVLYCRSGGRSAHALEFLRAKGFRRARHLKGGYLAWMRERRSSS
jgi:adenylyltransferase/sulfurtransferase